MDRNRITCGNPAYTLRSAEFVEVVEGDFRPEYLHLVIEKSSIRRVPRLPPESWSFFLWRPDAESRWLPFPQSERDRTRPLCFDRNVPPCESHEKRDEHLRAMILKIDGVVVLNDEY